ncbi:MAG: class I SAM-dependent methyltransferase [Deltaproteobacteria bacterium]|jgi:O-methyltransferase involved in polyketide biosynthesis|nr:class I SAM-dependent methyltransferase [Deltaproteobacteria bacterium]
MSNPRAISDTSLIPLVARIHCSKNFPEYFFDPKALSLEGHIPDDTILGNSSEYSLLASVARYRNMDSMVRSFVARYPQANVVYLGCGLETAYFRLNEPRATFYELDLPEIMAKRAELLGGAQNDILIPADAFDLDWAKRLDPQTPTLLVASGLFQYFAEPKITRFIADAKQTFPNVELIFDATNQKGLKYVNRYLKKTGNDLLIHFYIDDALEFSKKVNSHLLEERPFFTEARKTLAKKLKLYTRIAMRVVDAKKRAIILRLKLN